ncbi:nucleolar complex protein 2 homolog [Plakobranchus ocellatus]|uniref:Nucleolar complex protein 2 homolog n=1 Tax=Plakobranchus ocellatus TaxID=259542 RepID=A0AAV4D455_9GAST|nr:nucleolar complex protein 2 homolog [Plakobranchus ocellatus]
MATHIQSMASSRSNKSYKEMDVDTFLNADFDSESESSSAKSTENEPRKKRLKVSDKREKGKASTIDRSKTKSKKSKLPSGNKHSDLVSNKTNKKSTTKKSMSSNTKQSMATTLRANDPEFYAFLKGQDKNLLDNLADLSDSEDDTRSDKNDDPEIAASASHSSKNGIAFEKELLNMSSGDESDAESDHSGVLHQLPAKLEIASDEEEDEEEEDNVRRKQGTCITLSMVEAWSQSLSFKPSLSVFREVVSAFHAAVQEAGGDNGETDCKYRVEGGTVFNSIIRLCLVHVVPALQSMLQLAATEAKQLLSTKSARWKKLKIPVKSYISDLLQMLSQLSEEAMINAILKHVHKLVIYYANFPKLSKHLMKKMVKFWSTGEETTRVLAFLCINKILHLRQETLLEAALKQMYMAYVSNSRFTSPSTLPLINFMQKSLVELFVIDQTLAYQYAFVYIRQLAIHLRNAISVKKKNTCQAVYNWQYIHCLGLWVQLMCVTHPSDTLQPLIYPLTQTIVGTIKLLPTARFYPLRFHCVGFLNRLSLKTNTFIPTIPFLLEVFEQTDFNKRHKTVSLKPFNFAVILKFSKAQLHEKAFKDGLIDQLYEYLLESFNNQAHSIGFPELIIPSVIQLKDFLKKCKIANYCKQIKQIVDKIMEQSKVIVDLRKKSNIRLDDFASVHQWERQLEEKSTPLRKFYTSWRKLRDRELQHAVSNKELISGAAIDIPSIERKQLKKATAEEREDFSKLFENESESDDETRFLLKDERPESQAKKRKRAGSDSESEDYSDFDDDELEQLAQSASSGEDSDDEDGEDEEAEIDHDDDDSFDEDDERKMDVASKSVQPKKSLVDMKEKSKELVDNDSEGEDVVEDFVLSDSDSDSE